MRKLWPSLILALASCSTPDDPGFAELAEQRDRLRDIQEQFELVPPDPVLTDPATLGLSLRRPVMARSASKVAAISVPST